MTDSTTPPPPPPPPPPAGAGTDPRVAQIERLATNRHTVGRKRELKLLPHRLDEGEQVVNLAAGQYGNGLGLVAVTDRRVIFLDKGITRTRQEDFYYSRISSIEARTGMMAGKLTIYTSGNKAEIESVYPKAVATEIADYVRGRVLGTAGPTHHQAPPAPPAPEASSVEERLRRLRSMLDEGLIDAGEYEAKRARLLEEL